MEYDSSPKKLMITGCGRSGTRYITFILRRLGLNVGHEELDSDGIASWCYAVNADVLPWGAPAKNLAFEHIFHQVRHPLQVIPSACSFKDSSWLFICQHIPCSMDEPVLLRSAKYWYYWNLEAEKKAHWRYNIEDFGIIYENFCFRLGLPPNPAVINAVPSDINTRKYGRLVHYYDEFLEMFSVCGIKRLRNVLKINSDATEELGLTWELLRSLDSDLCDKIRQKAFDYGYEA